MTFVTASRRVPWRPLLSGGRAETSRHLLALSTYLGHANATNTYWYLVEATPILLNQVAAATERLHARRGDD